MAEEKDPFEAAMAELQTDDDSGAGDAEKKEEPAGSADPFEAAMQTMDGGGDEAATEEDPVAKALQVADEQAQVAAPEVAEAKGHNVDIAFLMDIKLNVTFEVGRAQMFISDLLSLGQGSVIELHRLVGEDLEIFVNGHLLATGEVVVVNEKFGAKITKILNPEERVLRLGGVG